MLTRHERYIQRFSAIDRQIERQTGRQTSPKKNAGSKAASAPEGVLANLPRTRPQRSSARRDAARRDCRRGGGEHPGPRTQATLGGAGKGQCEAHDEGPTQAQGAAKRVQDPAPRQGFETEGDPVSGPVQPPGSVDLLSSAAELAGELTRSGLSSGGRLLKDFLTRLPLN